VPFASSVSDPAGSFSTPFSPHVGSPGQFRIVIWHLLSEEAPYYYLNPLTFERKLKEWAHLVGLPDLLAASTRDFVTCQWKVLNLPALSKTTEPSLAGGGPLQPA
jgi:hypothetical protein